jgi:hypothetical protein
MSNRMMITEDWKESGCGLFRVISQHLRREIQEIHVRSAIFWAKKRTWDTF